MLFGVLAFLALCAWGLWRWAKAQQGPKHLTSYDDYLDYRRNGGQPPC